MVPVLIQIVLLGLAAAMAPLPVILAIALLDTRRPVPNSVAYVGGGLLVYLLLVLAGSAVLVQLEEGLGRRHRLSTPAFILMTVIGLLFLLIALITWRRKRQMMIPKWVDRLLGSLGPVRAFGLGLLLCSPGLKNVTLMVAAFGVMAAHQLDLGPALLAMGLFLAIVLTPPAAPLVTYLVLPRDRAEAVIQGWRAWIDHHAGTIVVIVSAAIGIILLQQGLSGLTQ